jgi:tRNA threonylcarbamoyl adenosine modification protein YeaZ
VRILGFDTATRATTVALLDTHTDTAIESRDDPEPGARPRHITRLMGLVVEVLDAAGVQWPAVDRVAVGVGPGTFTGLRIGVATAHALARARDIPLVGVSSLHALARGAVAATGGAPEGPLARAGMAGVAGEGVMAVIDARRGEVFAAGWATADVARADAAPVIEPRPLAPGALAEAMVAEGRTWLAVGDGAVEFREALERTGARIPEGDSGRNRVSAVQHCRLAAELAPADPEDVQPEYLRLPDAEITLRAARQP